MYQDGTEVRLPTKRKKKNPVGRVRMNTMLRGKKKKSQNNLVLNLVYVNSFEIGGP